MFNLKLKHQRNLFMIYFFLKYILNAQKTKKKYCNFLESHSLNTFFVF